MTSEADPSSATRRLKLVHEPSAGVHAALADGDRALYADGDLRASRESFERAYQLAERAADAQAMAAAALGLAGLWVSEHRTVTGAVMLQTRLQQCLAVLDPGSSLALRIRVRLAGESDYIQRGQRGDPGGARGSQGGRRQRRTRGGAEPRPSLPARA